MTKKDVVDFGTTVYLALIAVIVVCILILANTDNSPSPAPVLGHYQPPRQDVRVDKWRWHDDDDAQRQPFVQEAALPPMHRKHP